MPNNNIVICPSCLSENNLSDVYCKKCNAPIGPNATIDPIQSAIAEGRGISNGVMRPRSRIVVIGMWILFVPFILSYIFFAVMLFFFNGEIDSIGLIYGIGLSVLALGFGFLVVKTTVNFIRMNKNINTKNGAA
jgi:hypothetical protein